MKKFSLGCASTRAERHGSGLIKSLFLVLATSAFCAEGVAETSATRSSAEPLSLEAGFGKPPADARPLTWWHWNNGNISKDGIKADLEAMAQAGIAGAQLFDVGVKIPAGTI